MKELEKRIGYTFHDPSLLENALTHSSYAHENQGVHDNERLEFLGDSVLSVIVSDYLYNNFSSFPEGDLTRLRAFLVCEDSLYGFAKKIDLGSALRLGKGEDHNGGRDRKSILSDAFEAVLAAMYLDSDMETCNDYVLPFILEKLMEKENPAKDYKTALQEVVQQNPEETIRYEVIDEQGPDHDKTFTVAVYLNNNQIATGSGRSKKLAEQAAAEEALRLMGY